jgi:hypothetical protein
MRMPAMRVLVNTPAPQGSTGITTNVFPSMTLGCGAMAGNITSDNVGPLHLINIKRLAYTVRTPQEAFEMPMDYDSLRGGTLPGLARHCRSGRRGARQAQPAPAHPADVPRRARRNPRSGSPWWRASPPKWWTAFWPAAVRRRPVRQAARRNRAAIADWRTPAQKRLHLPPLRLPNRWSSSARRMCARRSKRTARSTSGRRRLLRLPPATWPIPVIFWCWHKAEEATWT